jgi:MoaA/NifB/PqqE/SkfB family radical SAM enzyme
MLEFQAEITRGCYLQCSHCSSDAKMAQNGRRFNFDGLNSFIKSVKHESVLYLSGGEPLLVHDLTERIAELSSKNTIIGMYSSGIKKSGAYRHISIGEAIDLKNSGLSECYFSIYDSIPENHDAVTRLPGSFNHTAQSILNFNASGIKTKAHVVLNKYSLDHIDDVINSVVNLGVSEIRLLSLAKSGRAVFNWSEIGVAHNDQKAILSSILQRKSEYSCKLTFSGIPELTPCRPLNPDEGCVAGVKLFYITFDGDIFPCACTRNQARYSIGNINNITFNALQSLQINRTSCLNRII